MSGHITGQQARELLEGTTPGPWHVDYSGIETEDGDVIQPVDKDAWLIAAAPSLAETVAWIYGAGGHVDDFGWLRWPLGGSWAVGLRHGHISIGPDGGGLGFRTPEDAEEAARALLAAAEEARAALAAAEEATS